MLVQARCDEAPDLMQDHRDRQEQRDHHGQLQWRQERRRHVGGDHRRAHRQVLAQRRGDEGVDLLGEGEQPGKKMMNTATTQRSRRVRNSVRCETSGMCWSFSGRSLMGLAAAMLGHEGLAQQASPQEEQVLLE